MAQETPPLLNATAPLGAQRRTSLRRTSMSPLGRPSGLMDRDRGTSIASPRRRTTLRTSMAAERYRGTSIASPIPHGRSPALPTTPSAAGGKKSFSVQFAASLMAARMSDSPRWLEHTVNQEGELQSIEEASGAVKPPEQEAASANVFARLFALRRKFDNMLLALGFLGAFFTAGVQGLQGWLMLKIVAVPS
eukprot:810552-Prymnesium_polylepis.1